MPEKQVIDFYDVVTISSSIACGISSIIIIITYMLGIYVLGGGDSFARIAFWMATWFISLGSASLSLFALNKIHKIENKNKGIS